MRGPLSKRMRMAVVLSAVWLLAASLLALDHAEQCNAFESNCFINVARLVFTFLCLGLLPLVVIWGLYWIRAAEAAPRKSHPQAPDGNPKTTSKLLAERLSGTAIRQCKICGQTRQTRCALFNENISYVVARRERTLCGFFCFPCMTKRFLEFEGKTLALTWWGIIGLFVGPVYLVGNLGEYVKHCYHFLLDRTSVDR